MPQGLASLRKGIAALKAMSCGIEDCLTGAVTSGGAFRSLIVA